MGCGKPGNESRGGGDPDIYLLYQPFKFPLGPEPEPEFPRRAKGPVDSGPRQHVVLAVTDILSKGLPKAFLAEPG